MEGEVGLGVQIQWQRDVQQFQGRVKRTKRMYVITVLCNINNIIILLQ